MSIKSFILNRQNIISSIIFITLLYYFFIILFPIGIGSRMISLLFSFMGTALGIILLYMAYKNGDKASRTFWKLLLIGMLFNSIGEILWEVIGLFSAAPPSGMIVPNVFYIMHLFFILLSLIYLSVQSNDKQHIIITIVDILISMIVLFTIIWRYFIEPKYLGTEITLIDSIITISYPLLEILIVVGIFQIVYLRQCKTISKQSLQWIAISLAVYFATDISNFTFKTFHVSDYILYLEPLWLLSVMLLGYAGTKNTLLNHSDSQKHSYLRDLINKHLLPFLSTFLLSLLFLPYYTSVNIYFIGLIISFFLILIRQYVMFVQNQKLTSLLRKTSKELENKNQELLETISELERMNQTREREAKTDFLTGACNRRHIDELIKQHIRETNEKNGEFSILLIDIDYFKGVNDTFGHDIGDEVLIYLSRRLENTIRKSDILGRFGGEEFIILLPDTPANIANDIGERLRSLFESHPIALTNHTIPITISVGIASYRNGDTFDDIYKRSDQALYEAKRIRNKVILSN